MEDIILELYFAEAASYTGNLSEIEEQCERLAKDHGLILLQFEKEKLPAGKTKQIESEIRGLIPQERGTIVTSRGFFLPLSNSKNLNLGNTPVLLVKSERKLVYVFPCLLGERYFGILEGLKLLSSSLPELPPLEGEMEDTLIDHVLQENSRYEKELTFLGSEVETSAGRADLVFIDAQGRHLIVEVEREANDNALGQVLRLCAAYEKKFHMPREKVRAAIACARIHEFIVEAAKRAGVEIWAVPKRNHS